MPGRTDRTMTHHASGAPIVIVVGPYPPPVHGAAKVTRLVTDNLRRSGAAVISVDTSGIHERSRLRHHASRIWSHVCAVRTVARGGPDVRSVYLTGAGGFGLWYQLVVVLTARVKGIPIAFHHHSYAPARRHLIGMELLSRVGGRKLVHVVLCKRMGAALAQRHRAIANLRVCSNAGLFEESLINDTLPSMAGGVDGTFVVGHLSNLSTDKGLDLILETMRQVVALGLPARLLLGGPAIDPRAADLLAAAQREFGDAMEQLGPVPPEHLDQFYRRLDVFLFPSRYKHEAEPMVVLEASQHGVPVLAFDVGCIAALLSDPKWLISVDEDFPSEAAKLVSALARESRRDMIRHQVRTHFDHHRRAALATHDDLIRELTAPRRARNEFST